MASKRDEVLRRKQAFYNASSPDLQAKKNAAKLLRDFVLSEEHAALVWRSARVAHAGEGFSPDEFRVSLENRAGLKMGNWINHSFFNTKKDPYRQLELQAWIKYLYYGGSRKRRVKVDETTWKTLTDAQGNELYADDQDLVMHYFGIETKYEFSDKGERQLKTDYSWHLNPVLRLRNELGGHSNLVRVEELNLAQLMYYYDGLMGSLEPLATTRWIAQEECQELLRDLKRDFFGALGPISYQVDDIMAQVEMDPGVQADVEELLKAAGMPVADGCVEIRGDILDFAKLLKEAWRYYSLSKVSGEEQLRAAVHWTTESVAADANEVRAVAEKSVVALKHGNAADWVELADRYRLGVKGVPHDEESAIAWYEKAAEASEPEAMFALGQIFERRDAPVALAWYRKAAELGHVRAQVQLGLHCENGTRKQVRNWKEAAAWYAMAAGQGDPEGLYHLGRCYELGRGVAQDDLQAAAHYAKAQALGCNDARALWARLQLYGKGVPKNEKEAIKTLHELEKEACAVAWIELGLCHNKGIGVKLNQEMCLRYFQRAAKAGAARGMYLVGSCLEKGIGSDQDAGAARQWYMRAARMGHRAAQYKCADTAKLGPRWMKELAEVNDTTAQVKLAKWNLSEKPCEAVKWLKAAKDRSFEAKRLLAECYLEGNGVVQDHQQAGVLAEQVINQATGKERMLAEAVLAQVYWKSDPKQGLYWADRAARDGHVRWALELVRFYTPSRSVNRVRVAAEGYDLAKAIGYFEIAAEHGSSSVARALGDFYQKRYATVPGQACTEWERFWLWSNAAEPNGMLAEWWYEKQRKKEAVERKQFPWARSSPWRQWNYL